MTTPLERAAILLAAADALEAEEFSVECWYGQTESVAWLRERAGQVEP